MAETLQNSRQEIETVNSNLELIVTERTDQLRESNQQISDSIDYASRIQRSLLPDQDRLKKALSDMAIVWQPKDVVGGDFYWHKTIGDREFIVIMDCTGHGVPGAFMTLVATSVLEQITAASTASLGRWETTPEVTDLMQQLNDGVSMQLNQIAGGGMSNDGLDAVMLSIPKHAGDAISAVPQWISIPLLPMGPASAGAATNIAWLYLYGRTTETRSGVDPHR